MLDTAAASATKKIAPITSFPLLAIANLYVSLACLLSDAYYLISAVASILSFLTEPLIQMRARAWQATRPF